MAGRTRSIELLESERNILQRIAAGASLDAVLEDLIRVVERASGGEMLGSILFLSEDGKHLLHGAAPSLPAEYNAAIHGIETGARAGSCGTAVYTGRPVYVADIANDALWSDFRTLALKHGLRACWSTPIRGADGCLIGTFANYYREPREPTERDLEAIATVTQTAAIAIERHRMEAERQRSEEQRGLLLHELNHRVKNLFTLTNSLVVMSARSAATPEEMVKVLQGRLFALSRAHELVQPGLREAADDESCDVPLREILHDIVLPYAPGSIGERMEIHGPEVTIRPSVITSIALVLHELATNAAKYGALSSGDGRISVRWEMAGATLQFSWCETDGPKIASPPQRTGFGTLLARRSIEAQLGGRIAYDWLPDGLRVRISLPLSRVISPAMDAGDGIATPPGDVLPLREGEGLVAMP